MTYTITILNKWWFNTKIKHVVKHTITPDMNTEVTSEFVSNPDYKNGDDPESAMFLTKKTIRTSTPKFLTIIQKDDTRTILNLNNVSFRLNKDYFTLEQKRIYDESQGKANIKGLDK